MKLVLQDRWGDQTTLWVRDMTAPELTDELERPVIDLTPFGRQYPTAPQKDDPPFKVLLDSFVVRPCRPLPIAWLQYPDSRLFQDTFMELAQALYVLTGKLLVHASK